MGAYPQDRRARRQTALFAASLVGCLASVPLLAGPTLRLVDQAEIRDPRMYAPREAARAADGSIHLGGSGTLDVLWLGRFDRNASLQNALVLPAIPAHPEKYLGLVFAPQGDGSLLAFARIKVCKRRDPGGKCLDYPDNMRPGLLRLHPGGAVDWVREIRCPPELQCGPEDFIGPTTLLALRDGALLHSSVFREFLPGQKTRRAKGWLGRMEPDGSLHFVRHLPDAGEVFPVGQQIVVLPGNQEVMAEVSRIPDAPAVRIRLQRWKDGEPIAQAEVRGASDLGLGPVIGTRGGLAFVLWGTRPELVELDSSLNSVARTSLTAPVDRLVEEIRGGLFAVGVRYSPGGKEMVASYIEPSRKSIVSVVIGVNGVPYALTRPIEDAERGRFTWFSGASQSRGLGPVTRMTVEVAP